VEEEEIMVLKTLRPTEGTPVSPHARSHSKRSNRSNGDNNSQRTLKTNKTGRTSNRSVDPYEKCSVAEMDQKRRDQEVVMDGL